MDHTLSRLSFTTLSRTLCPSCRQAYWSSAHLLRATGPHRRRLYNTRKSKPPGSSQHQASPLEGYYKLLLEESSSRSPSSTKTSSGTAIIKSADKIASDQEQKRAKARVVFGSRLAGPAERRDEIQRHSTKVAGVWVPPRPVEPDNCCMSGCVNCVWDRFRDELEEWAARTAEARRRLTARRMSQAASVDDDGGGRETNWDVVLDASDTDPDSLFKDIPVGIREFMRTEKLLREKHAGQAMTNG